MAAPYQLADAMANRLAGLEWPILSVAALAGVLEEAQIAPAIQVIPYGIQVVDNGDTVAIKESVLVMAVTRFANQRSGVGARQLAGPILQAAAALLVNWQPDSAHTPLNTDTPPQPQFTQGFGYYPLQFSSIYTLE